MHGIALAAWVFPQLAPAQRAARVQRWSAGLLRILAVRLEISGVPAHGMAPAMLVANHVSWLDVYALNAVRPARFVAKADILRWPIIGFFALKAGSVFIDRSRRRDVLRVNTLMATLLREGETVAVFPEGTTSKGDAVLPFRPPLLQPAVVCGAHLQAVAIRYARADGSLCSEADFAGDKTLFNALLLVLTQPVIHARLQFLPPIACSGLHRRDLAREAEQQVAGALGLAAGKVRAALPDCPQSPDEHALGVSQL
jgi:1-acyl-sn-glycerol-3-phosphate acyltransferase